MRSRPEGSGDIPAPPGRWRVEHHRGPAGEHVARPAPEERTVRLLEVTRPALVLGSSQPAEHVEATAAARGGVEVARRRSGGGAVLIVPGEALWCDVAVPAGDPLWCDDVGRAFHWLGEVWTAALLSLGLPATFHDGAMRNTAWSRHVCFAGIGPGEVLLDGRKVVGLAQRRTRGAAVFHCCALLRWDPAAIVGLFALGPAKRAEMAAAADEVATGIGPGREAEVRAALLAALPEW